MHSITTHSVQLTTALHPRMTHY